MKKAIIITPDNGTYFAEAPDTNAGDWIRSIVGNWFDCVRDDEFIAYVDDEGLLNGSEVNLIASIVFGRFLCGTVVVFGCLNANGEYDGENHNVPESAISRIGWVKQAQMMYEDNKVSI